MRLGSYPCVLDENSKSFQAYKKKLISEIHRHRYEFNNEFKNDFEKTWDGICRCFKRWKNSVK